MGQRECRPPFRQVLIRATAAALLVLVSPGCKDSTGSDQASFTPPERFVWACADRSVWQIAAWKDAVTGNLDTPEPARIAAVDDYHGSVWLSSPERLYRFDNDGTEALSLVLSNFPELHDTEGALSSLAADKRDGSVWLARDQRLAKFSRTGVLLLTQKLDFKVDHLALDVRKGTLWAAGHKRVQALASDSGEPIRKLSLNNGGAIRDIAFDQHLDSLWLAQERRLSLLSSTGRLLNEFEVPPHHHLSPDGRGRIWLAHDRRIYRYDATGLQDLSLDPKGLEAKVRGDIVRIEADVNDARLWVLSRHGLGVISSATEGNAILTDLAKPGCLGVSGDVHSPTVWFDGMSPGQLVSPMPDIALGFSDVGVGVDPDTITLTVNGEPVALDCQFDSPTSATCTPAAHLTEPTLALQVTLRDRALNLSSASTITVKLDTDGDGLADDVDPETEPFQPPVDNENPEHQAAEEYLKNYAAYYADVDRDGLKDIFLRPRPRIIVLMLDDLLFPANINRQPAFLLRATTAWGGYQPPEIWDGPLPGVTGAGELTARIGNTDTDTETVQMLLQPASSGTSGVILTYDGSNLTILDEMELGLVDGLDISSEASALELSDEDNDGRDDLVVTNLIDETSRIVYANPDGTFGTPLSEEDIALAQVWFSFTNALKSGATTEAALHFREDRRGDYQRVFEALHDELPTIAVQFRYFKRVQGNEDYAVYAVNRLITGSDRLFFVSFTKNSEGEWKMVAL